MLPKPSGLHPWADVARQPNALRTFGFKYDRPNPSALGDFVQSPSRINAPVVDEKSRRGVCGFALPGASFDKSSQPFRFFFFAVGTSREWRQRVLHARLSASVDDNASNALRPAERLLANGQTDPRCGNSLDKSEFVFELEIQYL